MPIAAYALIAMNADLSFGHAVSAHQSPARASANA
jgi:hypothetical protein